MWRDSAACRGKDYLFHPRILVREGARDRTPTRAEQRRHPDVREALALCAACQVRNECAEYADAEHIDHGIWGGLLPAERSAAEARRRRARNRTILARANR